MELSIALGSLGLVDGISCVCSICSGPGAMCRAGTSGPGAIQYSLGQPYPLEDIRCAAVMLR